VIMVVVIVQTSSSLSCPWFCIVVNLIAVTNTQQLVSERPTYSIVRVYSPRGSDARYGIYSFSRREEDRRKMKF
jgi:hypothetical protein